MMHRALKQFHSGLIRQLLELRRSALAAQLDLIRRVVATCPPSGDIALLFDEALLLALHLVSVLVEILGEPSEVVCEQGHLVVDEAFED
jgi:hypothetical protein